MTEESFDSLYLQLFENSNDPQYILDKDGSQFIKVNASFEKITGYSRQELESGTVKPDDIVIDPIPGKELNGDISSDEPASQYEFRIRTKSSEIKTLEVSVKRIKAFDRSLTLGSVRDVTQRKELESRLNEEIGAQKQNAIEAAKASVRIYQLTEKIRNAPRMTNSLLNVETIDELLEESTLAMCDPEGLNYKAVSFFLIDEDRLIRRHAHRASSEAVYVLDKSRSRYARVARGEEPYVRSPAGEFIVPIGSRNEILGVMAVRFDKSERVLFDDSETVRQGLEDIIKTIATTVGLMIDNLRLLAKVRQQSIVDQLTKVFNRRHFDQKLRDEFQRAKRYGRHLAMIMVDLDFFKNINDTYGHPQGDRILIDVSKLLQNESRETDVICRFGGDEFILLLPETDLTAATQKAERLRQLVGDTRFQNISGGSEPLRQTLSLGVAAVDENVDDETAFLKVTDDALYIAKRNGRNQVSTLPEE